jgi:aspartyl-tRNA(Asn)/glutamyl-tRNA(Gln) amidotransferase subunit C
MGFAPETPGSGLARKGGIIPDCPGATRLRARAARPVAGGKSSFAAMALSSSDISRIANLARLELSANESERMLTQLNSFFDIVQQMRAVDTTGIEPLPHPIASIRNVALRLREDVVSESDQRAANQRSAPAVEDGLFLVPKVIE